MCYPKPGPRCAGHTKRELIKVHQQYKDAMDKGNDEQAAELRQQLIAVQKEYYATPSGNKALRQQAIKDNNPDLARLADTLEKRYQAKKEAWKQVDSSAQDMEEAETEQVEQTESVDPQEKQWRERLRMDNVDTVMAVNDSETCPVIRGEQLPYMDKLAEPGVVDGESKNVAEFMTSFTAGEDDYDDGLIELRTISHNPTGDKLDAHYANTFTARGQEYVVDFSYAEVDPNAPWPHVSSVEEWKQSLERRVTEGKPDYMPPPPNPRSFSLPRVTPGAYNPLVEKAELEEASVNRNGTQTRFLSVDQVRVAAITYHKDKEGNPRIHSLETRPEYRHQGYMKALLSRMEDEYGVKPYSSGSYTPHGYKYTRHLTQHQEGREDAINFPEYTDDKPFSFVNDWVEGTWHS